MNFFRKRGLADFICTSIYFFKHPSNTLQHPSNTLQNHLFFRSINGRKKINRDFIKGGRGAGGWCRHFFYIKDGFPYNYISHFRIYCCDYCLLLNLLLCQHLISFWASLPAPKLWVVSGARCHVLAKRKQMTQKFKKWNKWHKTLNWKLVNISGCYVSKKETNETEL